MSNVPSSSSPRPRTSASATRMYVTITGRNDETGKIMCREDYGNEFEINGGLRLKGVGIPQDGERWLLVKVGNAWVLELMVGAPTPPTISGDRSELPDIMVQVLDAMILHGLVIDQTDTEPAPPPLDETTDPSAPDLDSPENEDLGDEGVPVEPEIGIPLVTTTGIPAPEVPKGKNDDKAPPSTASTDLFGVMTYNLLCSLGPERARQDLKRLYPQTDLLCLQESARQERGVVLEERPDNWGMHRPLANGGRWSPILWNQDVLQRLDGDTVVMSPWDGPGTGRPLRAANWVRFRVRSTGVVFTKINFHWENSAAFPAHFTPTRVPSAPRHIERYKSQMTQMVQLVTEHSRYGAVLLSGDFNVHAPNDLRERNPGLPTATFGKIGMKSNWEILGPPAIGTLGRLKHGPVFDWHMLKNRIPGQMSFVSSKVLLGYNSDHRPVSTRIRTKNFQ